MSNGILKQIQRGDTPPPFRLRGDVAYKLDAEINGS